MSQSKKNRSKHRKKNSKKIIPDSKRTIDLRKDIIRGEKVNKKNTSVKSKVRPSQKKVGLGMIIVIIFTGLTYLESVQNLGVIRYVQETYYNLMPFRFEKEDKYFKVLILPFWRDDNKNEAKLEEQIVNRLEELRNSYSFDIKVHYDVHSHFPESDDEAEKIAIDRNADLIIYGQFYEGKSDYETKIKYIYVNNQLFVSPLLFEDTTKIVLNYFESSPSYISVRNETDFIKFSTLSDFSKGLLKPNIETIVTLSLILNYYKHREFKKAYDLSNSLSKDYIYPLSLFDFQHDCLKEMKDNLEMIKFYTKLIGLPDSILDNPTVKKATLYNSRGIYFRKIGKKDAALDDYNESIKLDSEFGLVFLNKGNLLYENGKYQDARSNFSRAIEIDGKHGKVYMMRALSEMQLGDKHSAEMDFDKAFELNYSRGEVLAAKALLLFSQGDKQGCDSLFKQALFFDAQNADIFYNLASYNEEINQLNEAIDNFSSAIRLDKDNPEYYNGRGYTYNRLGLYDSAIADFSVTISLNNKHAYAYNNRGLSYTMKNDYGKAILDFEESRKISPDNGELFKNLGTYYEKQEFYEEALVNYSRASMLSKIFEKQLFSKIQELKTKKRKN